MRTLADSGGFTRLELTAVIVVCGLLAVPVLVSARNRAAARSQRIGCTNNLKQLGLAFVTEATGMESPQRAGTALPRGNRLTNLPAFQCFQAVFTNLLDPKVVICPADTRKPATNLESGFSNANLSYFIGVGALDTGPAMPEMLLTGDRNLTNGPLPASHLLVLSTNYPAGWTAELHHFQGNIGLADGSVQQFSPARLSQACTPPQRLAFP